MFEAGAGAAFIRNAAGAFGVCELWNVAVVGFVGSRSVDVKSGELMAARSICGRRRG